jgi:hypothetical protein
MAAKSGGTAKAVQKNLVSSLLILDFEKIQAILEILTLRGMYHHLALRLILAPCNSKRNHCLWTSVTKTLYSTHKICGRS